jgi:arsenate reductase
MNIYINPHCSKCLSLLKLLKLNQIAFNQINYLENSMPIQQLEQLWDKLDEPQNMARFDTAGLDKDAILSKLSEDISLLQRPIIELDEKAIIARPPEKCIKFLGI